MKSGLIFNSFLMLLFFAGNVAAEDIGNPEQGQQVFRKCTSCHMVGDDARNRVGPILNNIVGAPFAGTADFNYSPVFVEAGEEGRVWDDASLDAFLANPREFLPKNRMSFRGIPDATDRADLIAYLTTFSDGNDAADVEAAFEVAADILAIQGDVEYGEYLSSECKTCHQASGGQDGIPNIIGWTNADFVTALHAYRSKHRENPVMQVVTARLSDEEIAALAAYFGTLEN